MQRHVVAAGAVALIAAAVMAARAGGLQLALAVVIGAFGGVALYHAAFGFTGGWRRFIRERRGASIRAQLLLLGLTVLVSFPLIAHGREVGLTAYPWVFPVGVASAIGAAMFGFGMQLGGGCGSGTLFTAGGGSVRMMLTLFCFVGGSVLWTGTNGIWRDLPRIDGVSALRELGMLGAFAVTFALLAALWFATLWIERSRHGAVEPFAPTTSLLRGRWSLPLGAAALALVIILTFLVLHRPWGITSAFPLWGVKMLDAIGVPVQAWNGWSDKAMGQSVFAHSTSVMNFGVMLGALIAAGLASAFAPSVRLSLRDVLTAVIGGFLMGYGARLAYGCNIGGFLGGVASASLHGWWWLLFGWIGSSAGVRVREALGMDPPRASVST